jgi:hypothetical protein
MTGQKITHTIFGKGTVISQRDKYINIRFDNIRFGEKVFVYPGVFESFMRFDNSALQEKTGDALRLMHERETEEQNRVEAELREKRRAEDLRAMIELEKKKNRRLKRNPALR